MVGKGHDVPGVTLVAVLLADLSLNLPDFRAAERTLQLLVQVAGRAGRGDRPGTVCVQTFRPDHPSLVAAAAHDFTGFMRDELERRRVLGYPPFSRLVNLRLDGPDASSSTRRRGASRRRSASRRACSASAPAPCSARGAADRAAARPPPAADPAAACRRALAARARAPRARGGRRAAARARPPRN
jgi:primosomal protein N' (replication factor Y)